MKSTFRIGAVLGLLACVALAAIAMPHAQVLSLMPDMATPDSGLAMVGFGGLILNRGNMQMLTQAFNGAFKTGMALKKPMWNEIAMEVPSTTSEEKYAWLGMTTKFREWIGDRVYQNLKQHDYTIRNKDWEDTVSVKRNAIMDDQYGVYNPLMMQLGQDAALHPDELVFGLIAAGFSSTCYDGQYFFDTDHPVGPNENPVSVSNFQGGSGTAWYLLDTSNVMKPIIYQNREPYQFKSKTSWDDDNVFDRNEFVFGANARSNVGFGLWQLAYASKQTLDVTNYAAARAAQMSLKSDSGKPLAVKPNVLLVPPALEKTALDLVQAERLANGQDNTMRNTARVVVCAWL
ncbi:Mu-like prophage major head subunit gpT [Rhodoferax sp. OV413]|uniref:Mu-like prophage major head subunit gpT family protein n=1 Tax=Rhodoferax sp. OV413 TaxID=1855285 RepID=UPI0008862321|nr:Mu-like prophage major head subunit gpT family protein [Rhodoferax sp. OV413]SDO76485.1 Mu-like prophage major head subunit gpT [Rhodoferax sp. OV413]